MQHGEPVADGLWSDIAARLVIDEYLKMLVSDLTKQVVSEPRLDDLLVNTAVVAPGLECVLGSLLWPPDLVDKLVQ